MKDDDLLISCGNEDDPHIKVWSLDDPSNIGKYDPNDHVDGKRPYYYMNVVYLNGGNEVQVNEENVQAEDYDPVKKGFIVIAASIKHVDAFMKNPNSRDLAVSSIPS